MPHHFQARAHPIVCALNSSEIMILGGSIAGFFKPTLKDVWLFDAKTDTISSVSNDSMK